MVLLPTTGLTRINKNSHFEGSSWKTTYFIAAIAVRMGVGKWMQGGKGLPSILKFDIFPLIFFQKNVFL